MAILDRGALWKRIVRVDRTELTHHRTLPAGVLADWADLAGVDVGVFDRVLLLEATRGAQDAHVLRAAEAEPEAALNNRPPL